MIRHKAPTSHRRYVVIFFSIYVSYHLILSAKGADNSNTYNRCKTALSRPLFMISAYPRGSQNIRQKPPVLPTRFIVCKRVPVMNIGKILLSWYSTTIDQSADIICCNFFRFLSAKKQLRNISGVRYGIAMIVFLLFTIIECT